MKKRKKPSMLDLPQDDNGEFQLSPQQKDRVNKYIKAYAGKI